MATAFNIIMNTPSGIAATAAVIGTIVASVGIAGWLIVMSKPMEDKTEQA